VEGPVMLRADDDMAITRQAGHVHETVYHNGRAGMRLRSLVGEVARVKEIPLPVSVAEGEGIDGETVGFTIHKLHAHIGVRSFRTRADRDAVGEFLRLASANGVIEVILARVRS